MCLLLAHVVVLVDGDDDGDDIDDGQHSSIDAESTRFRV